MQADAMMRVAVLSSVDQPTRDDGGNGLGRVAWDLAKGLHQRGHLVTLYAGPGSSSPGARLVVDNGEAARAERIATMEATLYDVFVDLSHGHGLSQIAPGLAVINYMMDTECRHEPTRTVVANEWQRWQFPSARIVPLGIDVDAIPEGKPDDHAFLAYAAKVSERKGYDIALDVSTRASMPIQMVGENQTGQALPTALWRGPITDTSAFWAWLGTAYALLAPARYDAGGRAILEASACGVPVLTLDWSGSQYHVAHGVSGWIVRDADEMLDAVQDVQSIDRKRARAWVRDAHGLEVMLGGIERLMTAAAEGETW